MHPQMITVNIIICCGYILDIQNAPVGTAPTASLFSAPHLASMDWAKTSARRNEKHLGSGFGTAFIRYLTVILVCITYNSRWGSLIMDLNQCILHCCSRVISFVEAIRLGYLINISLSMDTIIDASHRIWFMKSSHGLSNQVLNFGDLHVSKTRGPRSTRTQS